MPIERPRPRLPSQWDFTSPFEGVVPHLYIDTRGHVTCGVGFLVPSLADLDQYPWQPSVETARADWVVLKGMPPGLTPRHYRVAMCARLKDADMRAIFATKMLAFQRQIAGPWQLHAQPPAVQLALMDMVYCLGAGGLAKYAKLRRALVARDYAAAAAESYRNGCQRARNDATAAMFARGGEAE